MLFYKPVTPTQRHLCLVNKRVLEKSLFIKTLFVRKNKHVGRDNKGHITVFHKEFGHKKFYRVVDFYYSKDIPYFIESVEYDPNRSSFINPIFYKNGLYSYIISTHNTVLGDMYSCKTVLFDKLKNGNRALILNIPIGTVVHNLSFKASDKAKYLRAAGAFGILIRKEAGKAWIKLPIKNRDKDVPSDKALFFLYPSVFGYATIGKTSNTLNRNINLGKAGRSRWLGIRPTVRGVAMNPIDHPHGGGEGKKAKKASPTNKWGTVIKYSRRYKRKKF